MKNIPNIKSKWTDSKGTTFYVNRVEHVDNQLWVHYTKTTTNDIYNCFVEAFVNRFTECVQ